MIFTATEYADIKGNNQVVANKREEIAALKRLGFALLKLFKGFVRKLAQQVLRFREKLVPPPLGCKRFQQPFTQDILFIMS